jgi:nucleoside-diphosphate-sugar epimerase
MIINNIQCGVIGTNGYLGQQLVSYICKNKIPIRLIPYDRGKYNFVNENNISQIYDVLLNLGTPNEIIARQGGFIAEKAIAEWSKHIRIAIQLSKPRQILNVSTFHIFGNLLMHTDENTPTLGGNPYGDLHLKCLEIINAIAAEFGVEIITVIPTNIYGTVNRNLVPRSDLILNLAINKLLLNESVKLNSSGNSFRDFLWIEDVLEAFCKIILNTSSVSSGRFVIASEHTYTVRNALEILFSVLGSGEFNNWCKFGLIQEDVAPFSFSCDKLRLFMKNWQPKSIFNAGLVQKSIFNQ